MSNQKMHRAEQARKPDEIERAAQGLVAALVTFARAITAAPTYSAPDALVPLREAATIAGLRSDRPLRDAIRAGEIAAYGRQRDRAVRRSDLDAWIESRRVVHAAIDDADLDRRVARLARERGRAA